MTYYCNWSGSVFTMLFGNNNRRSKTGDGSSATTRQEMPNSDLNINIF